MSELHFGLQYQPRRTKRIEGLLNILADAKPSLCFERALYVTESYKRTESDLNVLRRAKALREVLSNMTIYILPGSLLVGNQASKPKSAPLFPEDDIEWLECEILKKDPCSPDQRPKEAWLLPPNAEKLVEELVAYWRGRTHHDRVWTLLPEEAKICEKNKYIWFGYLLESRDAHYIPDFPYLLAGGLRENINRCRKKLTELDLTAPDAFEKKAFWEAVIISNEAVIKFAHRYAELAMKQADSEQDQTRRNELIEISRICRRIPEYPPESLHEALQLICFVMETLQIENSGHSLSLGRFDQYLYPFYQKDLETGRLTPLVEISTYPLV